MTVKNGGTGPDSLVGTLGEDQLYGGLGDDVLYSDVHAGPFTMPIFSETDRRPTLDTGSQRDELWGGGGDDRLFAGYGDEVHGEGSTLYGDRLYISLAGAPVGVTFDATVGTQVIGGATIDGIESYSYVEGSHFNDVVRLSTSMYGGGYPEFATIDGLEGDDQLIAGYYTATMFGGEGADLLDARSSQYLHQAFGGQGDDQIYANLDSIGTVYGGGGADIIYGGRINIYAGDGNDQVFIALETAPGYALGDAGDDQITSAASSSKLYGGDGSDILTGSQWNDVLGSANTDEDVRGPLDDLGVEYDQLFGGDGDDQLAVGYGDDAYGGAGVDVLRLSLGGISHGVTFSTDQFVSGQPFTLADSEIISMERLAYLRGSEFADTLTASAQSVMTQLNGGGGDDLITAAAGSGAVTFWGGAGDDHLVGAGGDDLLDGGAGNDLIEGKGGVDTVTYKSATARVEVNMGLTGAQDTKGAGIDTLVTIENVIGSNFGDRLIARDAGGGTLDGGAGDDTIVAGAGADVINGEDYGQGNDTVDYSSATSGIQLDFNPGAVNKGAAAGDLLWNIDNVIGTSFDDIIRGYFYDSLSDSNMYNRYYGGDGADQLYGGAYDDQLYGGAGDDLLEGSFANDRVDGGEGIDTATYATMWSAVTVSLALANQNTIGGGFDTLVSIENLTGSAYADALTGNASANRLNGGDGDDLLNGGDGDDVLDGGAGVDTASFAGGAKAVTVSLSIAGPQDTGLDLDTLISIENLIGTSFNDVFSGTAGANQFSGGAGFDAVSYASASVGVTVTLGLAGVQDTKGGGMDTLLSIENLDGSAFDDVLTGDGIQNTLRGLGGDDILYGGDASDTLVGGAGVNQLYGGAGGDTFRTGEGTDFVYGGDGLDTLDFSLVASRVEVDLAAGQVAAPGGLVTFNSMEFLTGSAFDDVLTGDSKANFLNGGEGDDVLRGSVGDVLNGGNGIDTANYGLLAGGVAVDLGITKNQDTGAAGLQLLISIENLVGSNFNDALTGNASANTLRGGLGDDVLKGGAGDDRLFGGLGSDVAVFTGARADYAITDLGGGRLQVVSAAEGGDLLADIDTLRFADGDYAAGDFGAGPPSVSRISLDTGASNGDGITKDSDLTVFGTGIAQTWVRVYVDGSDVGQARVAANGTWRFDASLSEGDHSIAGAAVSGASVGPVGAAFAVTIDTHAEISFDAVFDDSGLVAKGGHTSDHGLDLAGTGEAGATVILLAGGGLGEIGRTTVDLAGEWSFHYDAADGDLRVRARTIDLAGNTATSDAYLVHVDSADLVVI